MKHRMRIQYTEADKALMWERWRRGESLHAIARLFDRYHSSIGGMLSRTGGIRPRPRCRAALALALAEREEISRGVMAGQSVRAIARTLDRVTQFEPEIDYVRRNNWAENLQNLAASGVLRHVD